jgi:hypothetical protein
MTSLIDAGPSDMMDDATTALIIQLQLQDSKDEFEKSIGKGKNVEGSLSDNQLALQLLQEDLECRATMLNDRKMAVSMREAIRADKESIIACIVQEQAESDDRSLALRLGGIDPAPLAIEAAPTETQVDDQLLEIMVSLVPFKFLPFSSQSVISSLKGLSDHQSSCAVQVMNLTTSRRRFTFRNPSKYPRISTRLLSLILNMRSMVENLHNGPSRAIRLPVLVSSVLFVKRKADSLTLRQFRAVRRTVVFASRVCNHQKFPFVASQPMMSNSYTASPRHEGLTR